MEGQQESEAADANRRWTCEACGCNTNSVENNPSSCSICGSSRQNSLSDLMPMARDEGSASSQLLRRSFFLRRRGLDFPRNLHPRNFLRNQGSEEDLADDVPFNAVAALAMEAAGVTDASPIPGIRNRRDLMLRPYDSMSSAQNATADELHQAATDNGCSYEPEWATAQQLGLEESNYDLMVCNEENTKVVLVPVGSVQGRAVRAKDPLPYNRQHPRLRSGGLRRRRSAVGFRVCFSKPYRDRGKNMGGGYLVGVATSAFNGFNDRNSLQSSRCFWGIDDSGNKYEGPCSSHTSRGSRRMAPSRGLDVRSGEGRGNLDDVLFGSREALSVVFDAESRTLSFWRDGTSLGTLVHELPRSAVLYPIVVPFNAGVTVAITGMNGDPLSVLKAFAAARKLEQLEAERQQRCKLREQRCQLAVDDQPTAGLVGALQSVFSLYCTNQKDNKVDEIAAARLWYRCGLKLSHLEELLKERQSSDRFVTFDDFVSVIKLLLHDEVTNAPSEDSLPNDTEMEAGSCFHPFVQNNCFEVGDVVEVVPGFEKYGDAARGPMCAGDRSHVVEIQHAENQSVRVLHNGRRWWYRPQSVLAEKSGLIEAPSIWLIRKMLRAHGLNSETLRPLWGEPVTATSWLVGDTVIPKGLVEKWGDGDDCKRRYAKVKFECFGKVVSPATATSDVAGERSPNVVYVEAVDPLFWEYVGEKQDDDSPVGSSLVRKVECDKLLHAGIVCLDSSAGQTDSQHSPSMEAPLPSLSLSTADIAAVAQLDLSAIERMTKECRGNNASLARAFSSGLAPAIIAGIDKAEQESRRQTDHNKLVPAIAALGSLCVVIARTLFPSQLPVDSMPSPSAEAGGENTQSDDQSPGRIPIDAFSHMERAPRESLLSSLMSGARLNEPSRANIGGAGNPHMDMLRPHFRNPSGLLRPFDFAEQGDISALLQDPRDDISPGGAWNRLARIVAVQGRQLSAIDRSTEGLTASETQSEQSRQEGMQRSAEPDPLAHTIRRGGLQKSYAQGDKPSVVVNGVTRSAICNGILSQNATWFNKMFEPTRRRRSYSGQHSSQSALRNAKDEDGMPILEVAIHLGCSTDIVGSIIRGGAEIEATDIAKAAYSDQADVLKLLLQLCNCVDGIVDMSKCSSRVSAVIEEARLRQLDQEKNLQKDGEAFFKTVLTRLLDLALHCLRQSRARGVCHRAIVQTLIGRVLLKAMDRNRMEALKLSKPSLSSSPESFADETDSGRVPLFNDAEMSGREVMCPSEIAADEGLLFLLPEALLLDSLGLGDLHVGNESKIVHILEPLLWSREVEDVALGLSLTTVMLKILKPESRAVLAERYGLHQIVSLHSKYAESFNIEKARLQAHNEHSRNILARSGVVMCPKMHAAVLHITRHSSFRCDLCGKGVERGFPMHGCRVCDWDACECCINKKEGGIVKWRHVKCLAQECFRVLDSPTVQLASSSRLPLVTDADAGMDTLGQKLRRCESEAVSELRSYLQTPGKLSMYEFINFILPPLHEVFVGPSRDLPEVSSSQSDSISSNEDRVDLTKRRKKKPRFSHDESHVSISTRQRKGFQQLVVRSLVVEPTKEMSAQASHLEMKEGKSDVERKDDPSDGRSRTADTASEGRNVAVLSSELIRRIHEAIALFVAPSASYSEPHGYPTQSLQSLTKPIQLELVPSKFPGREGNAAVDSFRVYVEPLMPVSDLCLHIIRGTRVNAPRYRSFCERLSEQNAIIVERPRMSDISRHKGCPTWQLAQVVSCESSSDSFTLRYASSVVGDMLDIGDDSSRIMSQVQFEGPETTVVWAAREFFVLHRPGASRSTTTDASDVSEIDDPGLLAMLPIGTRVEGRRDSQAPWRVYTVVGRIATKQHPERPGWNAETPAVQYHLVSDDGVLMRSVDAANVRGHDDRRLQDRRGSGVGMWNDSSSRPLNRLVGFRRLAVDDAREADRSPPSRVGVLKRTWSALSPVESMTPIDLKVSNRPHVTCSERRNWRCTVGDQIAELFCAPVVVEQPPSLHVHFSIHDHLPAAGAQTDKCTIFSLLRQLQEVDANASTSPAEDHQKLYFSVHETSFDSGHNSRLNGSLPDELARNRLESQNSIESQHETAAISKRLPASLYASLPNSRQSGLDTISMQSMELLRELCTGVADNLGLDDTEGSDACEDIVAESFESKALTQRLTDQLDDTLAVVGGALPRWCVAAPTIVPCLFSYTSRKLLLERAAFGVSRSTLRQQEAKVNVGPLRERMAALRSRAVELVGEAFSGGAEDPTALQLQADELYGMEEALASRVTAAFRAQRWQELSLDCAKAAIRRATLLPDAASVMNRYAKDARVRHRRLEVRFDGESGFDAASGSEAGVTRGFYADVAEALLSCEHVSSTHRSTACKPEPCLPGDTSIRLTEPNPLTETDFSVHGTRLPLWIPDVDAGCSVIIPTPRANPRSTPGIFPRPMSRQDPCIDATKAQFRLIGRMFAAAMRDRFMFPLPLSGSFLKLVQSLSSVPLERETPSEDKMDISVDEDDASMGENSPPRYSTASNHFSGHSASCAQPSRDLLLSTDLPRPGFLGGEVYAVESFICSALDAIDAECHDKDEIDLRTQQVASDKKFAIKALGKSYECSFEDYFQDVTFVDPLDPTQGPDAHPLCPNGHLRPVNIHNVREWVTLAKEFILRDGIMEQALSFAEGVNDFFAVKYLNLFTPQELQRDICGCGDSVGSWNENDVKNLLKLDEKSTSEPFVSAAEIVGDGGATSRRFNSLSPTISYLIETLIRSSITQRRQFLSFVTSVPIATPGKIEVVPIVSPTGDFLPFGDNCLPRANTCARKLYLPKFDDVDSFSRVFWAVLREESRFKGFYEWRGN